MGEEEEREGKRKGSYEGRGEGEAWEECDVGGSHITTEFNRL